MRVTLPTVALVLAALPCATLSSSALTPRKTTNTTTTATVRHATVKPKTTQHFAISHTQGMDTARATQIQTALIKAGYLSGEPTGTWDAASTAAMQKMQGDNGWQTKITPDSRAIIKLGLGPSAQANPKQ